MNPSHTSKVYRKRLKGKHGWPLWQPVSTDRISIGDIGYLRDGIFVRMFNIGGGDQVPNGFQPLDTSNFTPKNDVLWEGGTDHRSSSVTVDETPKGRWYKFRSSLATGRTGAVLYLPDNAKCEDWDGEVAEAAMRHLKSYIKVVFKFAKEQKLEDVKKIILVTGLTTELSWAAAAFLAGNIDLKLESESKPPKWRNEEIRSQDLDCRASAAPAEKDTRSQCVYIRGFRAMCQWPLDRIDIKAFGDPPSRRY